MGKPYADEVAYIPEAYHWALKQDVKTLKCTIGRLSANGLISIGSGGSYTAASFQSFLHESITGKPSSACTPYQLLNKSGVVRNVGVSVLSAEGKNKDVLGCFKYLLNSEPQDLIALTLKPDSPLNVLAVQSFFASSLAYDMPWGKDGYLATNSLIATCVLLYRAYHECFINLLPECPRDVEILLDECIKIDEVEKRNFFDRIDNSRVTNFLIVTGLSGQIAGVDLESRLAESGMGICQVVDFRTFAHGRHLWASKNESNTAAIVLWEAEELALLENFKKSVPTSIPVLSVNLKGRDYLKQLATTILSVQLIKDLGDRYGIDPGQPEVTRIGREIYELDVFTNNRKLQKRSDAEWAVVRKFGGAHLYGAEFQKDFVTAYEEYVTKLSSAKFGAIVFDYDATLCTPDKRFDPLDATVVNALHSLLSQGVKIGIATGRGKSVPKVIFNGIDEKFHSEILIGMYNGSEITHPVQDWKVCEQVGDKFGSILDRINEEPFFKAVFKAPDPRKTQISFETKDGICCELAWRSVSELLQEKDFLHLKALRSTHSWDIVERNTSKTIVSDIFKEKGLQVLSIGDRGLWPGNDCELLSQGIGLGVDEVSPIISKAWNIAPQGIKGVNATLYYLSRLKVSEGYFSYQLEKSHE